MSRLAGNPIEMGGRQFFLPPLTVGVMRRHSAAYEMLMSAFRSFQKGEEVEPSLELLGAVSELFHACMEKANPDVTLEWVEDNLALSELGQRIQQILQPPSGALRAKDGVQGEATSP